ncbi:PolA DNA polymerase I - 3'-5' exonuclease and polymerase domains [uncultured Caudovirales phage]|uniref:PolA DNA polymerase I - 3'-5' exonuclease and polymerase domains n=1 Tax=uncultured Caudovirales phage TaxID=2100421 RepID=A0A6J5NAE5_9CAUD|nr:PolA DNA polymerase I - 3'-5' exonuclease and polymerase domains [uncultured Caudovirales phage]
MSLIDEVSNRIEWASEIVIDVETTGLDWRSNQICGYVFSFGPHQEDSLYLPVRHETGPNYDAATVKAMVLSHQNQPRRWIGHNMAFDLGFLHAEGISLNGPIEDTMINAALLNEFRRSFSLESCAEEAGVVAKKSSEIKAHIEKTFNKDFGRNYMGQYWRLSADDPVAIEYATGDGVTTWQLWENQTHDIDKQSLDRVHKVECDLIPILNRMTMRGIKINVDRLHRLRVVMAETQRRAKESLGEEVNVNSPTQILRLHQKHNLSGWPTTEAGNASFPEEYLRTSDIGRKIVAIRKSTRLLEAFIDPMIDRHLHKGRVHATFNQLRGDTYGTVTGRLSSSNPNLQAVPKRDEDAGTLFRSIFIPDEGMIWGSADYSQCEPRLLAHYSGCKVLVDGYNQTPSIDAHTAVAVAANIDRQSGKRLNQALLTGAGNNKAAMMLEKPMDEALKIVDAYFNSMPEIKELQRDASYRMKQRGFVFSILGRKSRLERKGLEYKAVNRILQCSNADMIKISMVKIDRMCAEMGGIDMLNNVHDSIDFQYVEGNEGAYKKALEIMCDFPEIRVPIEVEEDSGPDWAWASYGEKTWQKIMSDRGMI